MLSYSYILTCLEDHLRWILIGHCSTWRYLIASETMSSTNIISVKRSVITELWPKSENGKNILDLNLVCLVLRKMKTQRGNRVDCHTKTPKEHCTFISFLYAIQWICCKSVFLWLALVTQILRKHPLGSFEYCRSIKYHNQYELPISGHFNSFGGHFLR